MHRVKDHVFAIPTPRVAGDDITATAKDHLIDIAAKPDVTMTIGNWHRVIVGFVVHPEQSCHAASAVR
jgi:hypothetical protein